jgi:hypothetical protein
MRLRRLGMLGAAISFARSERGRRMIRETRAKYDTPENRAKARETLANLRSNRSNRSGGPGAAPTTRP